ncbi:Mrp family chromosome partitioning ATPase [Pseudonocardia autotrophica]|uniref:Tyrosine-protein kinase wzc n=2 Tax=Pseudonocardia TaxID=1847 RepID=A0A1Y2N878_PSEAH|nr:hypothetical protein [Pseudonocardia autotrophica]OSY43653.1 Tyrosine-protein kinase wzc [Pseudonocardia autotrophica]TDN73357.1 Mrp family chromosome partitioning ATPase [Pseudonocardia autotrophica]BBG04095.1 hypothetical protein Pdca_53040 [Pseudonocardia autotrophica]GEC26232.1 hypothetical protein PSA01_32610 [Pseudonocardia saturnea]
MRDTQADEAELGFWRRVIHYRWRGVLATVVVATLLAVTAMMLFSPGYTATAKLSVTGADAAAERQFLGGGAVRDSMTERLGSAPEVTVAGSDGESLLTVSATAATPAEAVEVANTYTEIAITERARAIAEERARTQSVFDERIAAIDARRAQAPPPAEAAALDQQRIAYEESAAAARAVAPAAVPVVVDPASPSGVTSPDLLTVGAGAALLALVAGLAAAGAAEHGDQRVRTAAGAASALSGPPLGSVPGAVEPGRLGGWWRSVSRLQRTGDPAEPGSAASDAIGLVRQRLQNRGQLKPHDAVVVFAVDPRDAPHATAVAVDLCRSVTRVGRSVLLVAADLRGGDGCLARLHVYSEGPGLSEVLHGHDATQAVQATTTDGLTVLPAGEPAVSPFDVLQGERFGTVLAELRLTADLLVVAAPPLAAHPDALAVADAVDSRVAVVGPNARGPVLDQGMLELEHNGVTLDGVVFAGRART